MSKKKQSKRIQFYIRHGVKHITGFLTPADKKKLQELAKQADKSLTRYVTRLLERHIRDTYK